MLGTAVESVSVAAELSSGAGDDSVGRMVDSCAGFSVEDGYDVSGFGFAEGIVSGLLLLVLSETEGDDPEGLLVPSGAFGEEVVAEGTSPPSVD